MGTQEQVVNFEVRITIIDLDAGLRPGMSCNATIETETKENVVTVPIQSVTARVKEMESDTTDTTGTEVEESLNGKDKFEEIVFLFDNGKAKRVAVETGISDDNFIEVLKGLEGGETVITGSYRAISRELEDGSLVMKESGGGKPQEGGEEE
jgi:HlyD family secretion protein